MWSGLLLPLVALASLVSRAAHADLPSPASASTQATPLDVPEDPTKTRVVQMPNEPGDDPTVPGRAMLRWSNQIGESRLHGAWLFSEPAHHGGTTTQGLELGYTWGATPALKRFRVGGAYGVLGRMADDKTFTASPYYELEGGVRFGVLEAYAFTGVSFVTLGASHAKFALGVLSPRAGVVVGGRVSLGLAVHVFAATEYNVGVLGFDDYRTTMLGVRLSLLTPPQFQMPEPPATSR